MKMRGRPRRPAGAMKPGENASTLANRTPSRKSPPHARFPLACRQSMRHTRNRMVQYSTARLDVSFGALGDATRRGVLEKLGRAAASITEFADKFHMTLTGMKKHVGVL